MLMPELGPKMIPSTHTHSHVPTEPTNNYLINHSAYNYRPWSLTKGELLLSVLLFDVPSFSL